MTTPVCAYSGNRLVKVVPLEKLNLARGRCCTGLKIPASEWFTRARLWIRTTVLVAAAR